MADQKVSALTTIPVVDRAADILYIVDTSAGTSNKVTPNTLLGITGAPVGDTDTATLTNKTITSPAISSPVFSGTITGTYTIGGTPTFPSSVVTLTGSQTLTSKILTSPTINTPTITNPTITVDSLSEFTSANGITIDGLNIKDGALNTNNSVPNTAWNNTGTFGSSWAWTSYAPTFTNLTTGNGTVTGGYSQVGKTVCFWARFTFGSTSSIGGTISVSLPVTSVSYTTAYTKMIGLVSLFDTSTSTQYAGIAAWKSTTSIEPGVTNTSATYAVGNGVTSTIPMTWATGDVLDVHGFYEAA